MPSEASTEQDEVLHDEKQSAKASKNQQTFTQKLAQGGTFYAWMIYGVSSILVCLLVIDSLFCALREIY